ncbi:MAG: rubrerythrin [Berkelbacteria bacterium GW2011_GWE1_39_12]|uniref:Rubrerythrin n=1 Tax=Berkelbacteria bacterium GW2011_GWE1_39_12 TaxID=1618337 RepID=A0A0G4B3P7_9BACT|nr:MAG: rubrerythrin [Berkelbacteria bacterium GW2011_GWE1_39_12]
MSKTQENLLKAFAGESMARNKYTLFAKQARAEGLEWVARVFEETADNERAHAERELHFIEDQAEMTNTYNIHAVRKTIENIKAAADGEKYEWGTMYPGFEKIAREEDQTEIADMFKEIGEVEEKHEERYLKLVKMLEDNILFEAEEEVEWKCLNCGYIHNGKTPPDICPACGKPHGWYMQLNVLR